MSATVLKGLRPRDYEHPFDRRALAALESNATLSTVVTKLNQYGIERTLWLQYAGSNLRAAGGEFGAACSALNEACHILDVMVPPELYIVWDEEHASVTTVGTERTAMAATSLVLRGMTRQELTFVFGHELGHVRSRHVVYSQLSAVLPYLGDLLKTATLGIGGLLSGGLQLSVNNWLRMADFSADRAGLLACQDLDVALSALIKLGGALAADRTEIDIADFRNQARSFGGYDFAAVDRLTHVVSAMRSEQPWTVMRASELIDWVDAGKYDSLLRAAAAATPPG